MKNQTSGFGAIMGAALFVLYLVVPNLWAQSHSATDNSINRPQITVGADAEIKVTPDQVVITLVAESIDPVLTKAKAKNDALVKGFTAAAKDNGVKTGDIQTDYINIAPNYLEKDNKKIFLGYTVRRRLVVTLKDISKFDNLYSDLVIAGATDIEEVEFQTTELRKYRDEARVAAVRAAAEKADLMATELGAKVGKPYEIREYGNDLYDDWGRNYGLRNVFNISRESNSSSALEQLPMAVGKISIRARVTVTFALE
jgi:hypothetical protein